MRISGMKVQQRHVAGVFFFLLAAQFITVCMLAAAITPDYDFKHAAISVLARFRQPP